MKTLKMYQIDQINFLSVNDSNQLINEFNNVKNSYPENKTIVALFEEQVARTPENVALTYENVSITYFQLNEEANRLANYLATNFSISKGQVVGVMLLKSIDYIISYLAILKIGGVYLPIDITYPKSRIDYILNDSNAKFVLSHSKISDSLNINEPIVNIDSFTIENASGSNLNLKINPKDVAYLIYTSGSTGMPKGVLVRHASNVNMSFDQIRQFEVTAKDNIVWFASVSFDASISEIMMALYSGATLIIPTEEQIKNLASFIKLVEENNVSIATFPPSYLNLLEVESLKDMRCIITAGEPANPIKAKEIVSHGISYFNAYGPTEYAVCATMYKLSSDNITGNIPIGKPISNTKIYILDDDLSLVPIGVRGTLYITGIGLAKEYINQPILTKERFISNPFEEGTLMYNTGDLGKWLPDGNIDFIGRKDFQVKIRGHRVELGEIEYQLTQFSSEIKQVLVDVKTIKEHKVIVAYYIMSKKDIDKTELKLFMNEKLPKYMMPDFFIKLNSLPLTPNGKIDRKALPDVEEEDIKKGDYIAPKNEVEQKLVEIWQEVLGIEKIGTNDNFFELGGHSLVIMQVINNINKQLNRNISFKEFFSIPTIESIAQRLQNKGYTSIPKAPIQDGYPMTSSQKRLWILCQFDGGSIAYNMPATVKLKGAIDIQKFEEAFNIIIEHHEILRTAFKTDLNGEVHQYVVPASEISFRILQKNFTREKNGKKAIAVYLEKLNNEAFNLEQAPLIRASLIKLGDNENIFFLSLHHIIADGWSMELLISQVVSSYNDLVRNKKVELPKLTIQYKDYATWLNSEIGNAQFEKSESYWLSQFQGDLPIIDLPKFTNRPKVKTYNGMTTSYRFSKSFLEKIKTFSKSKDVTLFMTLMAGINTLLYRYSGQNDIIVGTPIAGRDHPDLEGQMGLYLNTIAIRTIISDSYNFSDLIEKEKQTLLSAYEHQNFPFDELVTKLDLKRDTSRSALFDVMVILQSQSQVHTLKADNNLDGVLLENYEFVRNSAQFDMNFTFIETEGLHLSIEYNTDLYHKIIIEKIFEHFETLMSNAINNPLDPLLSIEYLTGEEKIQIVNIFNDTEVGYAKDKNLTDLFEEQVRLAPNNIAVVFGKKELTYKELNEKANQFGQYLLNLKAVSKGDFVSICLERSEYLHVVLLGVMKSGFAYVLIDRGLPKERIKYIIKDSESKLHIDDEFLKAFKNNSLTLGTKNLDISIDLNNIIYLMYTSGSTGNPKGAINVQKGFLNTLRWYIEDVGIDAFTKMGVISNLSFDLTQKNLFAPLLAGGAVYINHEFDPIGVKEFIAEYKITMINCAPTLFYFMIEDGFQDLKSLQKVILGGESINHQLISEFINNNIVDFYNSYGPSETSDISTFYKLSKNEKDIIPIGKPIRNVTNFILDKNLNLVTHGVVGEICIGGIGVGLGYYNKDELTKEKFIETKNFGKIYKTGDFGKYNLNNEIEFVGRKDNQIKINGNRIELEEIENKIYKFNKRLKHVIVDVKKVKEEKVLVAYYVSPIQIDKSDLRKYLEVIFPQFMIPSYFVQLENLPVTPNGKMDRKALPEVSEGIVTRKEYEAPSNKIEKELVKIWREILGVEKIGITDNFFELGGNSLKSYRIIFYVDKLFGAKIGISDVYENLTIKSLSALISSEKFKENNDELGNEVTDLFKKNLGNKYIINTLYKASYDQIVNWEILKSGKYGKRLVIESVQIPSVLDRSIACKTIDTLLKKHEILKISFEEIDGILYQKYNDEISNEDVVEFLAEKGINDHAINTKLSTLNFDLGKGPLVKFFIIDAVKTLEVIIISSHILIDGWSSNILKKDFSDIYLAYLNNSAYETNTIKTTYLDYCIWKSNLLSTERIKDKYVKLWTEYLKGLNSKIHIPYDNIANDKDYNSSFEIFVDENLTENIREFSIRNGVTIFSILLASLFRLMYQLTGEKSVGVGIANPNRLFQELYDVVGEFANPSIIVQSSEHLKDNVKFNKDVNNNLNDILNLPLLPLVQLGLKNEVTDLFSVMLNMISYEEVEDIVSSPSVHTPKIPKGRWEVGIYIYEYKKTLRFSIKYDPNLYQSSTIEEIINNYINCIKKAIE